MALLCFLALNRKNDLRTNMVVMSVPKIDNKEQPTNPVTNTVDVRQI